MSAVLTQLNNKCLVFTIVLSNIHRIWGTSSIGVAKLAYNRLVEFQNNRTKLLKFQIDKQL